MLVNKVECYRWSIFVNQSQCRSTEQEVGKVYQEVRDVVPWETPEGNLQISLEGILDVDVSRCERGRGRGRGRYMKKTFFRDREKERETERKRDRKKETETERKRQRQRERERETETETDLFCVRSL